MHAEHMAHAILCIFFFKHACISSHALFPEEWDDPRLESARREVQEEIKGGVHPFMILNVDQVWRQALRFSKTVLMKGPNRALQCTGSPQSMYEQGRFDPGASQ